MTDAVTGPAAGGGARTFYYRYEDPNLQNQLERMDTQLWQEDIVAGTGDLYSRTITRDYEDGAGGTVAGRYAGFHLGTEYAVGYGYEAGTGRLYKVLGPGLPLTYGVEHERVPSSDAPYTDLIARAERAGHNGRVLGADV